MAKTTWNEYRVKGVPTISKLPTRPTANHADQEVNEKKLRKAVKKISKLQRKLYADGRYSVLLVFQAMDAAGKDGTIRKVLSGVNPAGCHVHSFKAPSTKELSHDYMWRIHKAMPPRGTIGVFNRSHYEEALVVRVHPEYIAGQGIPNVKVNKKFWDQRLQHINEFESYAAAQGTIILKFWLNVSRKEQHTRFRARIEEPKSQWKFSSGDVRESTQWKKYMAAYKELLSKTSKSHAPWYAIPADDKPFMRRAVAEIVAAKLDSLDINYPKPSAKDVAEMKALKNSLL